MEAIATIPRTAGKGIILAAAVLDLAVGLLASIEKATSRPAISSTPVTKRRLNEVNLWQLYKMTAGRDSVPHKVRSFLQGKHPD